MLGYMWNFENILLENYPLNAPSQRMQQRILQKRFIQCGSKNNLLNYEPKFATYTKLLQILIACLLTNK